MTLTELINRYWCEGDIDLLVIDAEGHEAKIIHSIDFNIINPHAIFFESSHLGEEKEKVFKFLLKNDYQLTKRDRDTIAIKN